MTKTATQKVFEALVLEGKELTAKQIRSRYGVSNPHNVIYRLRNEGYCINIDSHRDSKGRVTLKYSRGTPSNELISAGYKYLRNRP